MTSVSVGLKFIITCSDCKKCEYYKIKSCTTYFYFSNVLNQN